MSGGLAAWRIVSLGLKFLNVGADDLVKLYVAQFLLQSLGGSDILGRLLFASALGWIGAFLSVGRHLRQIEPSA